VAGAPAGRNDRAHEHCLNVAIQRIGLGLAVTLEFLGPLAIALTRSKSKLDVLCAVSAGVGVYVLVLPGPSSDFPGIGIAVAGAACWAAYITLNGVVGQRLPGLQGPPLRNDRAGADSRLA
jgi:inner membrane transporter RhtA